MFFPCGGEHNDIVEIEEARYPVKTMEDAINEEGEGGGGISEAKGDLIKFKELATAGTKIHLFLVQLLDRDLPVSTLEIRNGKPASPI